MKIKIHAQIGNNKFWVEIYQFYDNNINRNTYHLFLKNHA